MVRAKSLSKLHWGASDRGKIIAAVLLIIILANAAAYAFTHFEGPSAYGDDPNYLYLASAFAKGTYVLNPGYIFSVRIMQFLPIAFFYELFGITNFTSTLWDTISYLGIIVTTFLLVKLFYGYKAALLSSFIVSIFPLITKFAVNTGEDQTLTFIGMLAVLMFLYSERNNKKAYYFAAGALLVWAWLISYEAGVIIALVLVYALIGLIRKRIHISRNSIFFIYGIAIAFLLTFIFSYFLSPMHATFATVTRNVEFYSAVGTRVNGLPTIPTTNTHLDFYPKLFMQYHLFQMMTESPNIMNDLQNVYNTLFIQNPSDFGIFYYYFIFALIALLALRDRRAFFIIGIYAFMFVFLEFGPMSISISLHPLSINYILTYRLGRFMMITVPAMSAVIGIALSKLLEFKNRFALALGAIAVIFLLSVLYFNSYATTMYWYYWQYYQESLVMPAANFLRYNSTVNHNALIYLEAYWHNTTVTYTGANFDSYYGDPSTSKVLFDITNTTNCSAFQQGSYVVWSGAPHCNNWINVYDMPPVKGIPENYTKSELLKRLPLFFEVNGIPENYIKSEESSMVYIPTNIYYVK